MREPLLQADDFVSLAAVERDRLRIFPHAHEIVTKIRLDFLLVEGERDQLASDKMG